MVVEFFIILEHATPEAFWIDRTTCRYTDETGTLQNPSLTDCPQAVSAVKAIAIAARQGQKIYTLTQKNAAAALPKLSLSRGVAEEIQNALAAGKEVTVHEKAINAYGFSGFGYIIIDPETGVGGYLIEGKGSGSWFMGAGQGVVFGTMVGLQIASMLVGGGSQAKYLKLMLSLIEPILVMLAYQAGMLIGFQILDSLQGRSGESFRCFMGGFLWGFLTGLSSSLGTAFKETHVVFIVGMISVVIGTIISDAASLPTPKECHAYP